MIRKWPRIDVGYTLLGLSAAGLIVLGAVVIARALEPPPAAFESLTIQPVAGDTLTVTGRVDFRLSPVGDCTNGIQAAVRGRDELIRLSAPVRKIEAGVTTYSVELPDNLSPGRYEIRLREVFNCDGRLLLATAPWLGFEVVR